MMKRLICILILGVELAACKQAADKKPVMTTADPAEQPAAIADSTHQPTDTVVAGSVPPGLPPNATLSGKEIRPLPFGPAGSTFKNFYKKDPWFYHRLIGEGYSIQHESFTTYTPTYPLPPIEKYTHAVDDQGRDFCLGDSDRQITVDSLFALTKYRIRFPDHNGFEVYYMTGEANVDTLFPQRYKTCEMNYKLYGYLIFYERATKTARLLPAFYDWFGESVHWKGFYIDSNYRIFTHSQTASEGDDKADIIGGPVEEVMIDRNGKFTIKSLKTGRILK